MQKIYRLNPIQQPISRELATVLIPIIEPTKKQKEQRRINIANKSGYVGATKRYNEQQRRINIANKSSYARPTPPKKKKR